MQTIEGGPFQDSAGPAASTPLLRQRRNVAWIGEWIVEECGESKRLPACRRLSYDHGTHRRRCNATSGQCRFAV